MRIEFTYILDDLQEALIREAIASDPRGYRRRSPASRLLGALMAVIGLLGTIFLLTNLIASRSSSGHRAPDAAEDLLVELLTAMLPGLLIALLTGVFVWNSWRKSKWRPPKTQTAPVRRSGIRVQIIFAAFFLPVIFVIVMLLSAPSITWSPSRWQLLAVRLGPWAVSLLLLTVAAANNSWQTRRQWFDNPGFPRPKVLELSEAGFDLTDAIGKYHFKWAMFVRARETPNLLLLIAENKHQWIIPKRAFSSQAELENARALIQNMIPNTTFQTKPIGFPLSPLG